MKMVYMMISTADNQMKYLIIFSITWLLITFIIKFITKRRDNKKQIRLVIGIIPLLVGIIYTVLNIHIPTYEKFLMRNWGIVLALVLLFLMMVLPDEKNIKRINVSNVVNGLCVPGIIMMVGITIYQLAYEGNVSDYSHLGWAESFESMVDTMSEEYGAGDWKKIDFEGLKETYIPMVSEAETNNDEQAFAKVLLEYQYEFYDSHIWLEGKSDDLFAAEKELVGNDYGMSMYQLENGDVIAILCEEDSDVTKAGIHNGTKIIMWDGVEINEAMDDVRCIDSNYKFEVYENEELMKPIFLAGKGNKSVDVTYINDEGEYCTVTLDSLGNYMGRKGRAIAYLYSQNRIASNNFMGKMINEELGYLRISRMHYDYTTDIMAELTGRHTVIYEEVDKQLETLKKEGMKYLIIDLRNNQGGYSSIARAVASLFTEIRLSEKSGGIVSYYTFNEGKWKDLPIVVLVNDNTISAADTLTYLLSQCPNVQVMGITSSSNSLQYIGGVCYLSDDLFEIFYPIGPYVDEYGDLIELTADRQPRVGFDVRIPVDYDAAMTIFNTNDTDYELEYAINYFYR